MKIFIVNKKQFPILFLFLMLCAISHGQSRIESSFDSDWEFKLGSSNYNNINDTSFVNKDWTSIKVPHTYNNKDMQDSGKYYAGDAYYRKIFSIDEANKGKCFFLRFEGVGSVTSIYLNGKYVSIHKGGYSAFAVEISSLVKFGEQDTLLLKVNNSARKDVIPINMNLFPIYGGIYRPVSLIITNPIHFSLTDYASNGIYIHQKTSLEKSTISFLTKIENKERHNRKLLLRTLIKNEKGLIIITKQKSFIASPQGINLVGDTCIVTNPHLWQGIKDPYLYSICSQIVEDGIVIDEKVQPLGLRDIQIVARKGVYLNGVKYPMYGVTRHQDREGFGSALTNEQHKQDLDLIREMGATTIRLAHYQQSDYVYSLADSMGFLIWAEIPFVNATSLDESENAHQQMRELVRQNMNHPSIYLWGMHNEVYSGNKDGHVPVLTRELNDICKTDDPERPTVSVSGYGEVDRPSNLAGDVQGINRYYGWYEGEIKDLNKWGDYLNSKFPDYKVMLSEYGADANIDQHTDSIGNASSIDPIKGTFFPEEYQTETHIQQWAAIQKHPSILASYLWNMFEFAVPGWSRGGIPARNLKGLITFDRMRKKDAFYWYKANWNPQPMLYLVERRDSVRSHQLTKIQLFSNMKKVNITLNDSILSLKKGVNDKHWIVDNVKLKKGRNVISAKGQLLDGKWITDSIVWLYK